MSSRITVYPATGEQAFLDADHIKLDGIDAGADITGNNPPQTHGESLHTNRTRTVFISAPYQADVTPVSSGIPLRISSNDNTNYYIQLPQDFVSLTSIKLIWKHISTPTATNIDIDMRAYYGTIGEVHNIHGEDDLGNIISANVPNDELQGFTTSLTLSGITKNDFLRLRVIRDGDDSCGYTIYIVGVLITYIGDM